MAAMGGVNKIFYPGTMEGALTISKESLVMDNEIAEGLFRVLEGVKVNDETLAVNVTDSAGPGGNYLKQQHTMRFIEDEHFLPLLADRQTRERWESGGSKSMVDKAHEKVLQILSEHQVDPLPSEMAAELERIALEVENRESTYSN